MDSQLTKILSACSVSTRVTAKTFFPERFTMPFAEEVHGKIFDLIDGDEQKVAIAAPRGWGKTSIVALALMARWILFRLTGFICYINKSHDAASLQTENLHRELVTNREIKAFFGDFKQRNVNNKEFDEVFSKKSWVAYNTLVWPRGAGQQVRGVLFKNDRPGLIVIDDLEELLLAKKLKHGNHPCLTWNASNTVIDLDPAGSRKFSKQKSYSRIDGMVALGMAVRVWKMGKSKKESYIAKNGIMFI